MQIPTFWVTEVTPQWMNEQMKEVFVEEEKNGYTRSVKYQQYQLYALASSEMLIINKYTIWNNVFYLQKDKNKLEHI